MDSPRSLPTAGVLDGLRALAGGVRFVLTTPGMWGYALVPSALFLTFACIFSGIGFWSALRVADWILAEPDTTLETVGGWFLRFGLMVLAMLTAFFLGLALAQPLSGFALDAIARAQALALTGDTWPEPPRIQSLWRGLKTTAFTLGVGLPVLIALTVIDVVIPPAMLICVPLKILWSAWLLAWDFCDYPFSMRGDGVRARIKWIRPRLTSYSAFGLAWAILLLVPGVLLIVLPMGVAGATRLVLQEEVRTRIKPAWEK